MAQGSKTRPLPPAIAPTLPDGGVRFKIPLSQDTIFRRFPMDINPHGDLLGFVNNNERQCAAMFRDGQWLDIKGKPLKWEPTHWTAMEDSHSGQ